MSITRTAAADSVAAFCFFATWSPWHDWNGQIGIDSTPAPMQNNGMGISILGVLIITLVLFVTVAILARLTLGD